MAFGWVGVALEVVSAQALTLPSSLKQSSARKRCAMVTVDMMTGWMDEFVVWVFADLDGMTEDDYVMTRIVSFSVNEV